MRSKIVIQKIDWNVLFVYNKKGQEEKFSFSKAQRWISFVYRGDNKVYFYPKSKEPCGFRSILSDGSDLVTIMLRGWSK